MTDAAPADRACTQCGKKQSELLVPLKQCAKCHTQAYCSRDCQKDDWKNHKRTCTQQQSIPIPGSHSNPPPEDLLKHANQTVALLQTLSRSPDFRQNLRDIPQSAAGLMFICDFASRTFREYWCPILPPQKFAELSAELESFHGIPKEKNLRDMAEQFEAVKQRDSSFNKDAWPRLDAEKYSDCISRNFMAAKIVQTPSQQQAMGGAYSYSDEVIEICRQISSA